MEPLIAEIYLIAVKKPQKRKEKIVKIFEKGVMKKIII